MLVSYRLLQLGAGHFHELNGVSLTPDSQCFGGAAKVNQLRQKRLNFVRCGVRHLKSCAGKHKAFLASHQEELKFALHNLIETIELVNLKSKFSKWLRVLFSVHM